MQGDDERSEGEYLSDALLADYGEEWAARNPPRSGARREVEKVPMWEQRDGKMIAVSAMNDHHLLAAARMLQRKGFVGPRTVEFYSTCQRPTADGALDAFWGEFNAVHEAPCNQFVDIFADEIKRRGLKL